VGKTFRLAAGPCKPKTIKPTKASPARTFGDLAFGGRQFPELDQPRALLDRLEWVARHDQRVQVREPRSEVDRQDGDLVVIQNWERKKNTRKTKQNKKKKLSSGACILLISWAHQNNNTHIANIHFSSTSQENPTALGPKPMMPGDKKQKKKKKKKK
jgi:hypothetical protein